MKDCSLPVYVFATYSAIQKKMAAFPFTALQQYYTLCDGFSEKTLLESGIAIVDSGVSLVHRHQLASQVPIIMIGEDRDFPCAYANVPTDFEWTDLIAILDRYRLSTQHHLAESLVMAGCFPDDLNHYIELAATQSCTVLLQGESGTGKEVVAQAIHYHPRSTQKGAFVATNCGAINQEFIESELFGHEKGSFTGAVQRRIGKCELASGGTLFLDEIGDMLPITQVKLLRMLQEREFQRLGSNDSLTLSARVIAATHRPLLQLVREKQFREDLFYRLNVLPIKLPALRERVE